MVTRYSLLFLAAASLPVGAATLHCVSFEYPPLIHQTADRPPEGLAVDVVSAVLAQMGHTMQLDLYPWARSLALAYQGQVDCIFTLYRSPERERYLDYSQEPVATQVIYLYARKDLTVGFDGNLASLANLRVGTAHKVNYGPKFEEVRSRLTIDDAPTIEQNFLKLALGRIDVAPSHVLTASFTLELPALPDQITSHETRFRHLDRRHITQAFLHAGRHQTRVAAKPLQLVPVRQQREKAAGNQMRRGFLARAEQ